MVRAGYPGVMSSPQSLKRSPSPTASQLTGSTAIQSDNASICSNDTLKGDVPYHSDAGLGHGIRRLFTRIRGFRTVLNTETIIPTMAEQLGATPTRLVLQMIAPGGREHAGMRCRPCQVRGPLPAIFSASTTPIPHITSSAISRFLRDGSCDDCRYKLVSAILDHPAFTKTCPILVDCLR
jgi:hypothetical protein